MSNDWQQDVLEFCRAMGHHVEHKPTIPPSQVRVFRANLIKEEMQETLVALQECDLVKIADGIGDSIVVLLGTAVACGISIQPIWDEIHRTNMLKKDGPVRADGKRLKPENWEHPRIRELLLEQME